MREGPIISSSWREPDKKTLQLGKTTRVACSRALVDPALLACGAPATVAITIIIGISRLPEVGRVNPNTSVRPRACVGLFLPAFLRYRPVHAAASFLLIFLTYGFTDVGDVGDVLGDRDCDDAMRLARLSLEAHRPRMDAF
jgi:hypothetical protein